MTEHAMDYSSGESEQENLAPKAYVEGVHPWRRFIARAIDTNFHGLLIIIPLAIIAAIVAPELGERFFMMLDGPGGRLIDLMLTLLLAMVLNALFIGYTGASFGKWLMGVRVREPDGSRLGYLRALKREVLVWFRGFGFGVPLVSLFTLLHAYKRLEEQGSASWDESMETKVTYRPKGVLQYLLGFLGVVTWLGFLYFTTLAV